MSRLDRYFSDYATYHRTSGNQRTHLVGIPMIVVSVLAWASHSVWMRATSSELPASLFQADLGLLIIFLASLWYAYLDLRTALAFAPVLLGAYWVGRSLSSELVWVLFIGGWILQFVGHAVYEKKSPAFFKNLEHLLIGPIWVFVKALRLD